jgi:nucleoside-diphosphate-sugar epimerase
MKVLLTGAFGNIGRSTLDELLKRNDDVTVFDIMNRRNKTLYKKNYMHRVKVIWGDLRDYQLVEEAVRGQDAVIHLGAVIPPLADLKPDLAESVNVGGSLNIIMAIEKQERKPKLVFSSSVAIYGDRVKTPLIKVTDRLNPNPKDGYAKQKVKCESMIRASSIDKWVILRLSAIFSEGNLRIDPIMFDMPLETSVEICYSRDVGLAMSNAIRCNKVWGKTLHIAGGSSCRISYGDFIDRMLGMFGFGRGYLPKEAFSKEGFHCGFMETEESERLLHYQRTTLDNYFDLVKDRFRINRIFVRLFRRIIRPFLLLKSPYYKKYQREKRIKTAINRG